jgi:hypothetical protein
MEFEEDSDECAKMPAVTLENIFKNVVNNSDDDDSKDGTDSSEDDDDDSEDGTDDSEYGADDCKNDTDDSNSNLCGGGGGTQKETSAIGSPKRCDATREVTIIRCSPRLNRGVSEKRLIDNGKKDIDGMLQIVPKLAFDSFKELHKHMLIYSMQKGFLFKMSNTYYEERKGSKGRRHIEERFPIGQYDIAVANRKRDPTLPRHETGFACRGRFLCMERSCPWVVHYTHQNTESHGSVKYQYVIKSESMQLIHSQHPMKEVATGTSPNYDMVCRKAQLTDSEISHLRERALYGTEKNIAKIKMEMTRKFKRNFRSRLLRRIINKYRDKFYGNGRDQIPDLVKWGELERQNGGAFKMFSDNMCQVRAFIFQTKEMREYAKAYNDFIILDGTHGTNQYGLTLEPPTIIDSLGKSVIGGIPICESEQSKFSREILEVLGLHNVGATLMTDEGSAFFSLAGNLGMIHLLCTFHFEQKARNVGGLGEFKDDYVKQFRSLIYDDFITSEKFDAALTSLVKTLNDKYPNANDAIKRLKSLYEQKHKVCVTFTKNVFSCGQIATSRAEGINASIKMHGHLKKDMKSYGLFQLVDYIVQLFKHREAEKLQEIVQCIREKETISHYVKKKWRESVDLAGSLSGALLDEDASSNSMKVWNVPISENEISIVQTYTNGMPPDCTCGYFRSTKLPCRCICYITSKSAGKGYYMPEDLHPRWRLDYHPLWRRAHTSMRIALPDHEDNLIVDPASQPNIALNCTDVASVPDDLIGNPTSQPTNVASVSAPSMTMDYIIPKKAFNGVQVPRKQDARFTRLKVAFEYLAKHATGDKQKFTRALLVLRREGNIAANGIPILNEEGNMLDDVPDEDGENVGEDGKNVDELIMDHEVFMPPPNELERKRAKITDSDVANHSRCNFNKKKNRRHLNHISYRHQIESINRKQISDCETSLINELTHNSSNSNRS